MRKLAIILSLAAASACSKSASPEDKAGAPPAVAGETPKPTADVKIPNMTLEEVDKALADKTIVMVDCNSNATRKRMGTIPGAILVDDEETYAASMLPADKNAKLVFYCGGPG